MAVTSIHPIKATISYALDYIMDSEKTDQKLLISGHGCTPETAAFEFNLTRTQAENKGKNLGWHLIQSFAPGEVKDYEKAHEIGIQLAQQTFGEKYEFVVATHIDKGHVHNHIIFNSVDMEEHKHYVSNYKTLYGIQNKNDKLCKENGLSVIKNPKRSFGKKDFNKRQGEKRDFGNINESIAFDIKAAANGSQTLDSFISNLYKMGYEVKQGKDISLRKKGMERFRRVGTLSKYVGEEISIDSIKYHIENGIQYQLAEPQEKKPEFRTEKSEDRSKRKPKVEKLEFVRELEMLIDKAKAYEQKKDILLGLTNTVNYIAENHIESRNDIYIKINELEKEETSTRKVLQLLESKIELLSNVHVLAKRFSQVKDGILRLEKKENPMRHEKEEMHSQKKVLERLKSDIVDSGFNSLSEALNADQDIKELRAARQEFVNRYQATKKMKTEHENILHNVDLIEKYANRDRQNNQEVKNKKKKNREHSL